MQGIQKWAQQGTKQMDYHQVMNSTMRIPYLSVQKRCNALALASPTEYGTGFYTQVADTKTSESFHGRNGRTDVKCSCATNDCSDSTDTTRWFLPFRRVANFDTCLAGGGGGGGSVPTCAENEHVSNGACTACVAGKVRPAGDDPSGEDTVCATHVLVSSGTCESNGYYSITSQAECNALDADLSQYFDGLSGVRAAFSIDNGATMLPGCSLWTSKKKMYFNQGSTLQCDGRSSWDCICRVEAPCSENEHVSNGACTACPEGKIRDAGDVPSLGKH